jgi:colicin import membrane protein
MTAAALTPPRGPRPTENMTGSFLLAVAMHALLVAALWIAVQWRTQPQGPVVAELWGALPQPPAEVAPPPPPPPPPAARTPQPEQPNADIVLQQERLKKLAEEKKREEERQREEERKREEQKKREAEQRKLEEAKRKAEEDKRAAAQREVIRKAEEQRMQQQLASGAPTAGAAAGGGRGDANYVAQLVALIKPRIVFAVPEGTSPQIYADFQVDLLPTGEILAVRLLKPSGLPGYDAAVERAIRRTDPFPRKRDGTVESTVIIRFRPVDAQ